MVGEGDIAFRKRLRLKEVVAPFGYGELTGNLTWELHIEMICVALTLWEMLVASFRKWTDKRMVTTGEEIAGEKVIERDGIIEMHIY